MQQQLTKKQSIQISTKQKHGGHSAIYSRLELAEFKKSLDMRLQRAQRRQNAVRISLSGDVDNSVAMGIMTLEDSADVAEKESLVNVTNRQQKFILEIQAAMERIDNGDYGVCISTGQLIDKDRLGVVPHTRLDLSAKIADKEVLR